MELKVEYSSGNYWYIFVDTYRSCWLLSDGTITTKSSVACHNNWKTEQEAQQFLDSWMPRKKQLTISEVKATAAILDEKAALDCSIEHWKQNVLNVGDACVGSSYCAVCERAEIERDDAIGSRVNGSKCLYCILNNYTQSKYNCCKEYRDFVDNETEENAITMLNKLVLIRNKKYGNPYEEKKKMANKIVFDDGKEVELSKETTERLRKELVKLKIEWRHGDIALSYWWEKELKKRLILIRDGKIELYSEKGDSLYSGMGQDYIKGQMEECGYKRIGNLFDDFTS